MNYKITGADSKTGLNRSLTLEADTEGDALRMAKAQGVFAYEVELDSADSPNMPPPQFKAGTPQTSSRGATDRNLGLMVIGGCVCLLLILVCVIVLNPPGGSSSAPPPPANLTYPPASASFQAPQESAPASRLKERYYRDGKGAIISESEAEENLRKVRRKISSMPDNAERAFMEGVLKSLDEEWARIKRQGPIEQ